MIDWSSCPAVERDAERVSGVWVFRGTRVPVAALFENLEDRALLRSSSSGSPGSQLNRSAPCWSMPRKALWLLPRCACLSTKALLSRYVSSWRDTT